MQPQRESVVAVVSADADNTFSCVAILAALEEQIDPIGRNGVIVIRESVPGLTLSPLVQLLTSRLVRSMVHLTSNADGPNTTHTTSMPVVATASQICYAQPQH